MDDEKVIRTPQQKRSALLKKKILESAKILISQKGFYSVSTNEIAKYADISIGSLYSYFKDKDAILMELVEEYNENFLALFQKLHSDITISTIQHNSRMFLEYVLDYLIRIHESDLEFSRELDSLYHSKQEITVIIDKQMERVIQNFVKIMQEHRTLYTVKNEYAAAVVAIDFLTTLVDRIVFKNSMIEKQQIKDAGIEMLYYYLFDSHNNL